MRIWALLGSLSVLLVPFAFIRYEFGNFATSTTWAGLLWVTVEGEVLGFERERTEFIQASWFETNGVYHSYFGDLWFVGVLILFLLILTVILSLTSSNKNNKNLPALLLLVVSMGLLLLRFVRLSELDAGFYDQRGGLIDRSYLEIPIGFLIGLFFSILDFRSD